MTPDELLRTLALLPARHKEASIIASLDDEPARPSRRLLDVALDTCAAARGLPLHIYAGRASNEPHWFDTWPGEHYRLLAALVRTLKPATVVEIGTFTGMGTLATSPPSPPARRRGRAAARPASQAVTVPATTTAAHSAQSRPPGQQQVHRPVEALRVASGGAPRQPPRAPAPRDAQAQRQPGQRAYGRPGRAFAGDHRQDLAARQAQVRQQAELLAPRQHLRAEARGNAEQADGDGHRLQPVGDGKAAVEDAQRHADFAGRGDLHQVGVAARALAPARARVPARRAADAPGASQTCTSLMRVSPVSRW
jgi:hypothetical protein